MLHGELVLLVITLVFLLISTKRLPGSAEFIMTFILPPRYSNILPLSADWVSLCWSWFKVSVLVRCQFESSSLEVCIQASQPSCFGQMVYWKGKKNMFDLHWPQLVYNCEVLGCPSVFFSKLEYIILDRFLSQFSGCNCKYLLEPAALFFSKLKKKNKISPHLIAINKPLLLIYYFFLRLDTVCGKTSFGKSFFLYVLLVFH